MQQWNNKQNLSRFKPYGTTRTTKISLKKLTEIEAYLPDEIEVRERISNKMKRFNTITGIVDTGLITSTVITGGISIAAFASGVGLPVGIVLSGTSLLLSLATAITWKFFKTFTVKQEKHDAIKLLAQSKFDSISNIISQVMQDGDEISIEFHKALQEVEKYLKLRADIRNQAKGKVKQISKEQRQELLEQGRFFTKNRKYFRYQGCQCHLKHQVPPPCGTWYYGPQGV